MLAALRPDGTLDPSFGDEGVARSASTGNHEATSFTAAVAAPDGRITIAGIQTGERYQSRIVRFDSDGRGSEDFAVPPGLPWGLARHADGKIVVYGTSGLVRYDVDGSFDDAFGDHGLLDLPSSVIGATAFAIDAQDRMIFGRYALVRLEPDGSLDSSFAMDGTGFAAVYGQIIQQSDGKLVAVGGGYAPRLTSCVLRAAADLPARLDCGIP